MARLEGPREAVGGWRLTEETLFDMSRFATVSTGCYSKDKVSLHPSDLDKKTYEDGELGDAWSREELP